jgi:hypothetical protein
MGGEVVVVEVEDVVDVDTTVDSGGVEGMVDDETGLVSAATPSESDPEQPATKIRLAQRTNLRRLPDREIIRRESNDFRAGS